VSAQEGLAERINFALGNYIHPSSFQAKIKAANARKE
jgi:hypothetical protein